MMAEVGDRSAPPPITTSKKRGFSGAVSADGLYVPPAKRRQLLEQQQKQQQQEEAEAESKSNETEKPGAEVAVTSKSEQKLKWEDQKRVVHGTINRLNEGTVKPLIHDLFDKVNLIRLRGVLAKSVLLAAMSSPRYSPVYAALIAVINTKLPEVGELVVKRSILAFRRHYRRREKQPCVAVTLFLGHLFHQAVVHELVLLQILTVLLEDTVSGGPTDDSVEVAVQLLQVTGYTLLEVSPAGVRAVFERLRALLHEGTLSKRVQYKMEALMAMRKKGFQEGNPHYPPIPEDLDLVEPDDQITFDEIMLDDEDIKKEDHLDVFRFDAEYDKNEQEWSKIRAEILGLSGDDSDSDGEASTDSGSSDGDESGEDQEEEENAEETAIVPAAETAVTTKVQDLSEADLVHLRRTIYLTIMSSATFEECAHKLAKIDIPPDREEELINMLIECCSQERTFLRYYGLIAARFCLLDDRWKDAFMTSFTLQYNTIHRLETNKLRNVAKMFAHLLHTDSLPWSVLSIIHLNEDETTSSSRIFIKILMQEIAEQLGIAKLKDRFETSDPERSEWYKGMFPKDNVRNTRYAINFFTSIGLGPLTDDLREFLKNAPKLIMEQAKQAALAQKEDADDSSSVSSSSSSESSSSLSSSSSESSLSTSSYSSSSSSSRSSYSSGSSSDHSRRRGRSRKPGNGRQRRRRSDSSISSRSSSSSRSRSRRKRGRSYSYSSDSTSDSGSRRRSLSDTEAQKGKVERRKQKTDDTQEDKSGDKDFERVDRKGRKERQRPNPRGKRSPSSSSRSSSEAGNTPKGRHRSVDSRHGDNGRENENRIESRKDHMDGRRSREERRRSPSQSSSSRSFSPKTDNKLDTNGSGHERVDTPKNDKTTK